MRAVQNKCAEHVLWHLPWDNPIDKKKIAFVSDILVSCIFLLK